MKTLIALGLTILSASALSLQAKAAASVDYICSVQETKDGTTTTVTSNKLDSETLHELKAQDASDGISQGFIVGGYKTRFFSVELNRGSYQLSVLKIDGSGESRSKVSGDNLSIVWSEDTLDTNGKSLDAFTFSCSPSTKK